ncbi:Sulfate transporter/antisigma-factor antagonist STAS [Micromonospora lupini str. Lupac 08]|uniref:Anti-sigma factor antagonist n=1 Tax=Micromonospora lupini str. Lupac 08 TaxID=1150864 RepID=I0L398_9ACTN|nr:Sulfate transporter/antisigma-factor antagonist STAS [Micromonospora lupini str. Lupac 08]
MIVASVGRAPEATPLSVSVDRSDPDRPLIRVGGELAYATAAPLRAEVDRVLADAPRALVLDFADLTFIDSTGLAVIVHAWREGQSVGTTLRLRAVPRFLATILDITGVAALLGRPLPATRAVGPGSPQSSATA